MTHQESLKRLKEGNAHFVKDCLKGKLQNSLVRDSLISGQEPYAIILGCADSRVVPELIFDTGLGELFTVRVAGNVANTFCIASVEYAITYLETKLIVVLGHQGCGVVAAAISGGDNGYNLNYLLNHIALPTTKPGPDSSINEVVKINTTLTAANLIKRSSIIRDAVTSKEVKIVAAYYNLDSGKVDILS